ncbi:MAG: 16S rRNA (uracil(1498)-N(3))-methyltransferase [Crocinitomicaceae bacterium]
MKISKHLFFCNNIDNLTLSKEESHHATRVLRLKSENVIKLMDGKGTIADAIITEISKNEVTFKVTSKTHHPEPNHKLHIAIAPTKSNDRIEFFLEKCTEIGISEITPIICKNSERKNINFQRWQKIITSAAKQSQAPFYPKLNQTKSLEKFLKFNNFGALFIAHCEESSEKLELKNHLNNQKEICILIGPEGDFTKEEINFAIENNYTPVSLGKTRLRTETAGIVACHTVNLIL